MGIVADDSAWPPIPQEGRRACVCGHRFDLHDRDIMGRAYGCYQELDHRHIGDQRYCLCPQYREASSGPRYAEIDDG